MLKPSPRRKTRRRDAEEEPEPRRHLFFDGSNHGENVGLRPGPLGSSTAGGHSVSLTCDIGDEGQSQQFRAEARMCSMRKRSTIPTATLPAVRACCLAHARTKHRPLARPNCSTVEHAAARSTCDATTLAKQRPLEMATLAVVALRYAVKRLVAEQTPRDESRE